MASYSYAEGVPFSPDELLTDVVAPYGHKFAWFMEKGYQPHTWQAIFHGLKCESEDRLARYRHLIAGRRGGKTMSAAWEVLYYALHPEQFHWDTRRVQSKRSLWIQVLAKDHKVGRASLLMFREVLETAGLVKNVDYKENRGDLYFEFPNGTLIEWKTAVDPQSLRGAGLDILWIDEAAFIVDDEAFNVIHPALMQKLGTVICTTTPAGKNWYFKEFFGEGRGAYGDDIGSVEYRSIDNPYFTTRAWELEKRRMHPRLFKQEYMAAFDSMAGRELHGEWLTNHFYTEEDLKPYIDDAGRYKLKLFIGVDPASSLADTADHFAMALIGVTEDNVQAFLIDTYLGRIDFPAQVQKINEWFTRWRPQMIGIEATAYQRVLAQQTMRLEGLPPIAQMLAKGKKEERIMSMSPLFSIGKVRTRATQSDFIDQWLNYDSTLSNPEDDLLDAVEIALRTAGALLPARPSVNQFQRPRTLQEAIAWDLPGKAGDNDGYDEHLGSMW